MLSLLFAAVLFAQTPALPDDCAVQFMETIQNEADPTAIEEILPCLDGNGQALLGGSPQLPLLVRLVLQLAICR